MSKSKTPRLDSHNEKIKKEKDETLEHAEALYNQLKGKANEIYEEGKHSVCEAQDQLKHHTDNLVKHVKEKPISSLLIAGGIGFIISALFKK